MTNINRDSITLLRQVCNMLGGPSNSNSPVPASSTPSNQLSSTNTPQNVIGHQTLRSPSTATPSPQQNQSGPRHSSVEEHRRLFSRQSRIQPYGIGGRPVSQQRGCSGKKKEKSVTRTMFCLADKDQTNVPCSEKLELLHNGLGEKRISFPMLATSTAVKDLLYESYPPLKHTGGFQILLSKEKSRKELRVVSHGCGSTEQIRCLGTGRIYIRPLQRSIPVNQQLTLTEGFEECLSCLFSIPISQMREHRENCMGFPTSSSDESDNNEADVEASGRNFARDGEPPENNERGESSSASHGTTSGENINRSGGSGDADRSSVLVEQVNAAPIPIINLVDDNRSVEEPLLTNNVEHVDRIETYADHVKNAVRSTLSEMAECEEPVTVLRTFQQYFLRGRPLDIESVSSICEGKTTEIVVSRLNLFEDGMEELTESRTGDDPSVPLEVTFTGENAEDYGGPRREFLGAMVREIKDRLFVKEHEENTSFALTDNIVAKSRRHYYGVGIVFGYCMLQGGPLPCFIDESLLRKVFGKEPESLKESEEQMREGLAKFGLVELFQNKPCLCHLLRITAVAEINYHRLVKLFVPSFSLDGSNQRIREEKSYRYLINYMKEVAVARRGSIELGDILKFATGSANEPVLGYRIKPTICFNDDMPSCIPTSNTCINKMTLAIGDIVPNNKDDMFKYFDYAFANDYFGMV